MAQLQLVNILACPPNAPFSQQPTLASPCPAVGITTANIMGTSIYSNTANPSVNCSVAYQWWNQNQIVTGTLLVSQTQAAIIAAS
jgi:hypothetical protein